MDIGVVPCCPESDSHPRRSNVTLIEDGVYLDYEEDTSNSFQDSGFIFIILAILVFIGFSVAFRLALHVIIGCFTKRRGTTNGTRTGNTMVAVIAPPCPRPFTYPGGNTRGVIVQQNSWMHDGVRTWWAHPVATNTYVRSSPSSDLPPSYAEAICAVGHKQESHPPSIKNPGEEGSNVNPPPTDANHSTQMTKH